MIDKKSGLNISRELAEIIAADLQRARQEWIDAPKCNAQENKEITHAAFSAIRTLVNEVPKGSDSATPQGKWRADYLDLVKRCRTNADFLTGFQRLTESFETQAEYGDPEFFLHYASEKALLAADEKCGRKFRLSALHGAGVATGAFATLNNSDAFASRLKSEASSKAQLMADIRHKDSRQDKEHVNFWANQNKHLYLHRKGAHKGKPNLDEMAENIESTRQVSTKRSTVRRWLTDWAKENSVH